MLKKDKYVKTNEKKCMELSTKAEFNLTFTSKL